MTSTSLSKGFAGGTHRLVPPEVTLDRIAPLAFSQFGITRCADVTGLDQIGISTFAAIRPTSKTVQVSNGKGLRRVDAQVSALMEAIELHHAENPRREFRRAAMAAFDETTCLDPRVIDGFDSKLHFDDESVIEWTEGEELITGAPAWLPASAIYYLPRRSHFRWTSNGLASGNHLTEATLHAIYEVIERHTMSGLVRDGRITMDGVRSIDLSTIDHAGVRVLVDQLEDAGIKLVLLRPPTQSKIHTMMAVLLDETPAFPLEKRVDMGHGAHLDPAVAAIRAITEAAQSRLTAIHGSREDLRASAYAADSYARPYRFFARLLTPNAKWSTTLLANHSTNDLAKDLAVVLETVNTELPAIYRATLTSESPHIAIVKVIVPGALYTFPF